VHKGVKKEQNTMHCYLNPFREFAMYMVILVAVYLGVIIEQVLPPSHCLHWDLLTVIFKPCNSYAAVRYAVYIYGRPKPMYGHTNTELMGNFLVLHQIYIPSDIHSFRYTLLQIYTPSDIRRIQCCTRYTAHKNMPYYVCIVWPTLQTSHFIVIRNMYTKTCKSPRLLLDFGPNCN